MPQLTARAVATISALVQMRAQVLAQFGIDLLLPAQASAFARIVATMNARLSAQLAAAPGPPFNPLAWTRLAALNSAIDQVQVALQAGLLAPPTPLLQALTMPGGIASGQWATLLRTLRQLVPLIAATLQLNAQVTETAQLAAALRVLARLQLPALAAPQLMASLTAALTATAQLRASLGADPLVLGLPAVQAQVQAKLQVVLALIPAQFGMSPAIPTLLAMPNLVAMLLAMLPKLPVVPTSFATPAVVQLALQAEALAAITWQVPVSVPAVQTGLATCALVAQLQAALNIQAVLPAPCGSGCDAAALLRGFQAA